MDLVVDLSSLCPADQVLARKITIAGVAAGDAPQTLRVRGDQVVATSENVDGKLVFDLGKRPSRVFTALARATIGTKSEEDVSDRARCLNLGRIDCLAFHAEQVGVPGDLTVEIEGYFLGEGAWRLDTASFYVVPCPVTHHARYEVVIGRLGGLRGLGNRRRLANSDSPLRSGAIRVVGLLG
uniref:Uncharacterized protein n=1 Tax=Marseillevirus LCMAC103 TaxID=2506604 RepID=A0A481YW01_9VIRU|nr:MAG: hypothetical protein LCMAC103_03070 [Marseillevirus LCMAC103]